MYTPLLQSVDRQKPNCTPILHSLGVLQGAETLGLRVFLGSIGYQEGSSNPPPSTRESGEIGGSSRSVAHRYLQLYAIVRTQLGGPPTVAGFKVLILRLQPRAKTVRSEGAHRRRGIVHEE